MMHGLVCSIGEMSATGTKEYVLLTEDLNITSFDSNSSIAVGAEVDYGGAGMSEEKNKSAAKYMEKFRAKMAKLADRKLSKRGVKALDDASASMLEKLRAAAALFLTKLFLRVPIVVRFHNDADGSSGAYCLFKAISSLFAEETDPLQPSRVAWRMQPGIAYSKYDALDDIVFSRSCESIEKPLLLVIDFGTTEESNYGLERLADRFDVIWLDHHPMVEDFKGLSLEHYINPWNFGADSNYTAGYLACTFARTFSEIDTHDMEQASMIGDYSIYVKPDESSSKMSEVLDLLTSDKRVAFPAGGSNLTPSEIDYVLSNKKRCDELLRYAKTTMNEALDTALSTVKTYKAGGALIYVVDFKSIRGEREIKYPLPGRFASKFLDRITALNEKPCIAVVHFSRYISIRCGKNTANLTNLVREIRKEYEGMVEAAGGHSSAASIKLSTDENKKDIINAVIEKLKNASGSFKND